MLDRLTRLTIAFCFLAGSLAMAAGADTLDRRLSRIESHMAQSQAYMTTLNQLSAAIPQRQLQPPGAPTRENLTRVRQRLAAR